MVADIVAAAGITAGASLLGSAFGGSSPGLGKQYRMAEQYTGYAARVKQAKAAGLHPLFAMGGTAGSSPGFAIPGQKRSGSAARNAIEDIGKFGASIYQEKANLVTAQAALSAVELARHTTSNDMAQMTIPMHRPEFQEIKKGQTDPHYTKSPEQSLNVKSPMTQVRIGSQKVWVPVEEIDEFMENPLAVGGLTVLYHGNKNVSWSKLANDYAGPGGKTPSWKKKLISKASRFLARARRPGRKAKAFKYKIPTPARRY